MRSQDALHRLGQHGEDALAELHRILKPGAAAVLSVDSRIAGVRTLLDEGNLDDALDLLRTGRTRWRAQRQQEAFDMKMFTPDELKHLAERAGFLWLACIGKTCLVQRRHESWLEDKALRLRLLEREEQLHADPGWLGLGSHLQFAVQRK